MAPPMAPGLEETRALNAKLVKSVNETSVDIGAGLMCG